MVILHDIEGTVFLAGDIDEDEIDEMKRVVKNIYGDIEVLEFYYDKSQEELDRMNKRVVSLTVENGEYNVVLGNASESQNIESPLSLEVLQQENKILKAQNQALAEQADFHEDVLTEIILELHS